MTNRKNTASCLSRILNESLQRKFGKIPSASKFADQFNLRAYGTKTITRETARKWLVGIAVPEIDKLVVLIDWLDIDVMDLFGKIPKQSVGLIPQPDCNQSRVELHINQCLKSLSDESKNALLLASWMLKQLEQNDFNINVCEKLINDQLSLCSSCKQKLKTVI